MNEDKSLEKMIDLIQKKFRIKDLQTADRWMIKLFNAMPIQDLEKKYKECFIIWNGKITPTRQHIIDIAKITLDERHNLLNK